jgi:hypothetical protein
MTGQFPVSRAETSDTLSGAMGLVVVRSQHSSMLLVMSCRINDHLDRPAGSCGNRYVISGEVEGPKLKGKIAPVGADWLPCALDLLLEPRYRRETLIPSMFELAGPWPPD